MEAVRGRKGISPFSHSRTKHMCDQFPRALQEAVLRSPFAAVASASSTSIIWQWELAKHGWKDIGVLLRWIMGLGCGRTGGNRTCGDLRNCAEHLLGDEDNWRTAYERNGPIASYIYLQLTTARSVNVADRVAPRHTHVNSACVRGRIAPRCCRQSCTCCRQSSAASAC